MANAKCFKSVLHGSFTQTFEGNESSQHSKMARMQCPCYEGPSHWIQTQRRRGQATSVQVKFSVPKIELTTIVSNLQVLLLLCCIWSVGLVWSVNAYTTHSGEEQSARQPFSDIITFQQVPHSAENDSSAHLASLSVRPEKASRQSHRVGRVSIWPSPLRISKLRHRLFSINRPLSTSGRESKPPGAYSRLSQFVRNRLHNLNLAWNSKLLHHKGRSLVEDNSHQLTLTNETVALSNKTNLMSNSSASQEERTIRRQDDTWINQIDSELNATSKSASSNAPYMSPTLNVIDLEPYNTKIAHNILVVRKSGKPGSEGVNSTIVPSQDPSTAKLQTPAPVVVSSDVKNFSPNRNSATTFAASTTTTGKPSREENFLEFVPIKNNHRPSAFMSLAKWKLKNKDKLITSTTQAKMETSTPSSSSSKAHLQGSQIASTRLTARPTTNVPTTVVTTTRPSHSTQSTLHWSSVDSVNHSWPSSTSSPHSQWLSSIASDGQSTTLPVNSTGHTIVMAQSELVADLTTREQWSTVSALSQDDFWSSYATENPMTTVFTTGSVTEFDLPITRPSTDANESTQSWEKVHNSDGAQQLSNGWKETAWSEPITTRPFESNSTSDRSTTTKSWTGPTSSKQDDNSIELLKEYQHKQTWQTNMPSSSTPQTPVEDKADSKINLYHSQQPLQQSSPRPNLVEDGVVIFKNNHGRPRRPLPLAGSTPSKQMITAKPPYVTDFVYPTTISVKKPAITIANIAAHRVKQPDEVQSASLTVLDPPFVPDSFMALPLNTTIVHKNILVPMKEGRPKPIFPLRPTTHFPVYPVVAGVSNWQAQTTPWILPVMTTSSPDKLEGLMPSSSNTNFSFGSTEDEFKWYTSTTSTTVAPTKTVSKLISVYPVKSVTASSIDRVGGGSRPSFSTSSTASPVATSSSTVRPASYPVATSSGYVNAIYAPPMPVMRPAHSLESGQTVASWLRPFNKLVSLVAPQQSGSVSFLSVVRSVLYSLMVMLLPPLALMSAFSLV